MSCLCRYEGFDRLADDREAALGLFERAAVDRLTVRPDRGGAGDFDTVAVTDGAGEADRLLER